MTMFVEPDLFLFLKKVVYQVKASGQYLIFNILWLISTWTCNKNKLYITFQTVIREICSILFLINGLGLASPQHFVYDFSRKIFLVLYAFNIPHFVVWLHLPLEILGNICIAIIFIQSLTS